MNGGLVVAAAVLTIGGSCLYTDPINMPPSVNIDRPLAPVLRGDRVPLTATVSDPDHDSVTLEWAHVGLDAAHPSGAACPSEQNAYLDPATWPDAQLRVATQSYEIDDPVTQFPFCVWAFARDRHGAMRPAVPLQIDPGDHAPVARIEVVESFATAIGFPLYAPVKFSGAGSRDDDRDDMSRLSYTWSLVDLPPLSSAVLATCDATGPAYACLSPDVPGRYSIQLSVTPDGVAVNATTTTVTVAEDQLPCLTATDPSFSSSPVLQRNPTEPGIFTILRVDDDGDPYPGSMRVHFSWFIGRGAGPMVYVGPHDLPSYLLPADAFTIGDDVRLRVEIQDRHPDAVQRFLASCADDADACYSRPGCTQRVTWKIEYR